MNSTCSGTSNAGATFQCGAGKNSEYRPEGYFWAVHVEPQAVGTAITVQVYDPAYMKTQIDCASLNYTGLTTYRNDYASTDASTRYSGSTAGRTYCSGDYIPGSSTVDPPVTSFAVRHANDTFNPKAATPINPASARSSSWVSTALRPPLSCPSGPTSRTR
jgi:hypothetical protein